MAHFGKKCWEVTVYPWQSEYPLKSCSRTNYDQLNGRSDRVRENFHKKSWKKCSNHQKNMKNHQKTLFENKRFFTPRYPSSRVGSTSYLLFIILHTCLTVKMFVFENIVQHIESFSINFNKFSRFFSFFLENTSINIEKKVIFF